ncbi:MULTISPECIES: transcriptional regulator GcvA [unclassified Caballeronia]|uniref:transcriptional regulator GcvA n=1 Tax=unclassified Caballeronia TaxID=2646786 RepID=UPI0028677965|nr:MULTISPECIES: transcriptional regulator GcvA [unclassified Caballeronia]MDR5776490.1 transcriptional regulator GcvA [Caballeronia sp. LZ002]MDR5851728.1 transcriptional regulator GcvA [Caballeronia sp. LZ003]
MRAPNNLNALRAFEAVSRHLSYSAAAEELNVTPAAVGHLVRGLEDALDVELFHRTTSGATRLFLTDAARSVLPALQSGFDLLSETVEQLKASKSRTAFTVTVPAAFADKWLLRRVDRFQQRHPYYDLRIDTSNRLVDFAADRVDVGIRYGAGTWSGLTSTFLLRDEFFPVCSPSLLRGKQRLKTPADLQHHLLIHDVSMQSSGAFPTWRSWLHKAGCRNVVDCNRGIQINDSAAAYQTAISGNGVALGRTTLVEHDLKEEKLVKPFDVVQTCELAYYLVHKKGSESAAPIVAFKEWLISEAGSRT